MCDPAGRPTVGGHDVDLGVGLLRPRESYEASVRRDDRATDRAEVRCEAPRDTSGAGNGPDVVFTEEDHAIAGDRRRPEVPDVQRLVFGHGRQ
jgi:hypothetical protein